MLNVMSCQKLHIHRQIFQYILRIVLFFDN